MNTNLKIHYADKPIISLDTTDIIEQESDNPNPPVETVNLQNTTENVTDVVFSCNAADGFPTTPPETAPEFSSAENGTKSVILTWKRGFNGGHAQTFVIRTWFWWNFNGTI
ncbi:hypothetical protein KUTeg_006450 [Tegillarca granosa]|uniref:Fibronectin type-III domain-containing protein n=1 Tax=Tegillarca granosa TaxID=220873 RepID=A0ABQ9FJU3_TEGGR|nr:hypothetical protein KUTeg_006450 [Tegillarca granosa]